MQEAIGREIGLVVGIKGLEQNARKQLLKLGKCPANVMAAAKNR